VFGRVRAGVCPDQDTMPCPITEPGAGHVRHDRHALVAARVEQDHAHLPGSNGVDYAAVSGTQRARLAPSWRRSFRQATVTPGSAGRGRVPGGQHGGARHQPETMRRLNRVILDYQHGRLPDDANAVVLEWQPTWPAST
jgi:hypothetical protein